MTSSTGSSASDMPDRMDVAVEAEIARLGLAALEKRRFADEEGRYILTQPMAFEAVREVVSALGLPRDDGAERTSHRNVPNGDPCPTCGFRIVTKEAEPFSFDDDPSAPNPSCTGKPASDCPASAAVFREALALAKEADAIAAVEEKKYGPVEWPSDVREAALRLHEPAAAGLETTKLGDAIREAVRAAWELCDGTEKRGSDDTPHVDQAQWEHLAAKLDGVEELIPEDEQPASAGHAVTLLIARLASETEARQAAERELERLTRGTDILRSMAHANLQRAEANEARTEKLTAALTKIASRAQETHVPFEALGSIYGIATDALSTSPASPQTERAAVLEGPSNSRIGAALLGYANGHPCPAADADELRALGSALVNGARARALASKAGGEVGSDAEIEAGRRGPCS